MAKAGVFAAPGGTLADSISDPLGTDDANAAASSSMLAPPASPSATASPAATAAPGPPPTGRSRRVLTTGIAVALAGLAALGLVAGGRAVVAPAPSPPRPAPLAIGGVDCAAAEVTGAGASPEIARALGVGACARLAVELGVDWNAPAPAPRLGVAAVLGTNGSAEVTLSLGPHRASGEGARPLEAVAAAVQELARELAPPPLSPAEVRAWGAADAEGARRIRRVWRRAHHGFSSDAAAEAQALVESDPGSPLPHVILACGNARGSEAAVAGAREATRRLDKLPPGRARAVRGALRTFRPYLGDPGDEDGVILLQKAYSEIPDDPDFPSVYSSCGCLAADWMLPMFDRLSARSAADALPLLVRCVFSQAEGARRERYLEQVRAALPEAEARLASGLIDGGQLEEAEAALDLADRLGPEDPSPVERAGARGRLALARLDPAAARGFGEELLGDPRWDVTTEGAALAIGARLMAGEILEGEAALAREFGRQEGAGQVQAASRSLYQELRLRRWLGRPATEGRRFRWLEASLAGAARAELDSEAGAIAELALARPGGRAAKRAREEALSQIEALADRVAEGVPAERGRVMVRAIPLVRAVRGDAAAAQVFRESRVSYGYEEMALDGALALEAEGRRDEAEQAYLLAQRRAWEAPFEAIAARARLAALYRAAGREGEARALDAVVDRAWAGAAPWLRDAVRKMK